MEFKNTDLSINELTDLIEKIKKQEEKKYQIPIDIKGLTRIEYYKENIKLKKFSLQVREAFYLLYSAGFVRAKDSAAYTFLPIGPEMPFISIGSDKFVEFNRLAKIVTTTYHEIRHVLQHKKEDLFDDYEELCILSGDCVAYYSKFDSKYILEHDKFYHEIDANLYGIKMAELLLKQDDRIYEMNKNYLERKKAKYEFEFNNYDFDEFFPYFCRALKDNNITKLGDSSFWDNNNDFRMPSEIVSRAKQEKVSEKLMLSILSSNAYLDSLNFTKISEEDSAIISNVISKKIIDLVDTIEINNQFYQDGKVDEGKCVLANDLLMERISQKERYFEMLHSREMEEAKTVR